MTDLGSIIYHLLSKDRKEIEVIERLITAMRFI